MYFISFLFVIMPFYIAPYENIFQLKQKSVSLYSINFYNLQQLFCLRRILF